MTEAQKNRLRTKIQKYKDRLAWERRTFGGYDDSGGLRYLIPEMQMNLFDLTDALRYRTWFWKNFSDDIGNPFTYLAWTAMYYHRHEPVKAENEFYGLLFSNLYIVPFVLGRTIERYSFHHGLNWEGPEMLENFQAEKLEFITDDFKAWLAQTYDSEKTRQAINDYVKLETELQHTELSAKRSKILDSIRALKAKFFQRK